MAICPVYEYPVSRLGKKQYGEDKPGVLVFFSRVAGPVEFCLDFASGLNHFLPASFHEPSQFVPGFFLHPQQHQEGAHLNLPGFTPDDHAESLPGLSPREGAAATFALAQYAHV